MDQDRPRISISRRKSRRGVTTVEFVLVAPLVFLVAFASFEVARMSLLMNLAQDACYDAARYAMVDGATSQEAIARANEVLALFSTNNAEVIVNNGLPIGPNDYNLTVQVRIPMEDNAFLLSNFYNGQYIDTSITLRLERYRELFGG